MNPYFLIDEENETIGGRRESSYAEFREQDTLHGDILAIAKLREFLSKKHRVSGITIKDVSSVSTFSKNLDELQQAAASLIANEDLLVDWIKKWDAKEWMPPSVVGSEYVIRIGSGASSEKTSRQKDTSVAELISNYRTSSDLSFTDRLAARIESLVETSEEEFPEQEPMSSRSLGDFFAFIRSIPSIVYPDVVLTYEGNIRAEWTKARNKHFAIEFLGNNEVRYVVFAPDPKQPFKTNRASGLSSLDSLMEIVYPYDVLDWITDPNKKAA